MQLPVVVVNNILQVLDGLEVEQSLHRRQNVCVVRSQSAAARARNDDLDGDFDHLARRWR